MKLRTWQRATAPERWPLFCVALFMIGFLMATIIPSFQAPDEFDHSARAYMLSRGQVILDSVDGSPSGGQVDEGLLDYMRHFTSIKGNANRKISAAERNAASGIPWSGHTSFVTAVGTAYYFPILYIPEAIGLAIGEATGLSVETSYRLSRYFALGTCFALLLAAFRLFPPPTLVLALLALPMNLFLLSSAVLDGIATCATIFVLSVFMRFLSDRESASKRALYMVALGVAFVAACRANLLPLLLLPFAMWWLQRTRTALITAVVTTAFVLGWTIFTIDSTVYPAGLRNIDHGARLIAYLVHPWEFGRIVLATISDRALVHFYFISFIGVLGWLDAAFSPAIYKVVAGALVAIAILSFSQRNVESDRPMRGILALCAVAAVLLTFLAMLVQWTVGPSTTVDGIQGRYFMIPAVIVAYALFGHTSPLNGVAEKCRVALTFLLLTFCTYVSMQLLVTRYYTAATQPVADKVPALSPSDPLTKEKPVVLHFAASQIALPRELDQLGLRFGTYMSSHPGRAALVLRTNSGETLRVPFELSDLADNAYKQFTLDGKRYISGEIISEGGQGVSTYQVHLDGSVVECMQTRSRDGGVEITTGCTMP